MKKVLITGASRGIGQALAQRFLNEGWFVIGTSRSGDADFIHENLVFFPLEISDDSSRGACIDSLGRLGKKIDVLINNAGIWNEKDHTDYIDINVLKATLETNSFGLIDFTERLLKDGFITEQIINISSRKGSLEYTTKCEYPAYSISKTVLNMFTRILAARYKDKLIISSIHPGFVKTDMNEGDGDISAAEAADDIINLIKRQVESGQFWYKGEKFPW